MAIQVGQNAPDFCLYDTTKQQVVLKESYVKKNVLLLFFPLAFTSTCTRELCAVRDDIGKYFNDDVEVFGISVDSVYTLARYKEDLHINYTLLSDFNKRVSADYDTLYTTFSAMEMRGVSKRSAFIVDRSGIIRYVEVLENASAIPDFNIIDKILSGLSNK